MHKIKKPIKVRLIIFSRWMLLFFIAFSFSKCRDPLPPEEGRKHLRAFDNEIIQLARRIGKTEAFGALIKLSEFSNPPIPYMNKNSALAYDYSANKGLYYVNAETGAFEKQAQRNWVELIYPFDSKHDSLVIFTLSDYAETQTALQMAFPQRLEAKVMAGNKTLFTAHLSATFEHDFPAKMDVEIIFANFKISMLLSTTFRRSHAILNMEFEMEENGEKKLSTTLTANVITTDNTTFYNNIDISLAAFPLRVAYQSDQDFLNSEPENFIETFNKHTQIGISTPDGNQIGQIFLARIQGRDHLNPMIRYPDGNVENLEDMLFIIHKIINMKMFILNNHAGAQRYKHGLETRPSTMAFGIIK